MKKWVLPGILLLGFLLRVLWLDKYPVGFTPDEASFGYDAYSILKTGKDQWGRPFPLVLESFGDFKSPLYAYLAVPSVALFGLNKFAVRLPNAILGTAAILVLYFLVKELAGYGLRVVGSKKESVSLIASFLLAISPWHIMLSRGAFEANLITFFLPLGVYLFLAKKYNWSAFVFGLTLFTYHSAKLIAPVIFIALLFIFKVRRFVPIFLFFSFLALMLYANSLGGSKRIAERSIFVGALEEGAKAKIELINKGMNPTLARLLHNKYQVAVKRFFNNYFQYFSPRFLLSQGPTETTYGMLPGLGVLTWAELFGLVVLIIHLAGVLARRIGGHSATMPGVKQRFLLLLVGWLLLAPVPAALSTGVGYAANRAAGMMPVFQILAVIGLVVFMEKYKKAGYIFGALVAVGLGIFLYKYFVLSPKISSKGMLAGNLEMAQKIVASSEKYDSIVVPRAWSEPHIYIAFAAGYDPQKYQEATQNWKYQEMGVSWVDQIPEYRLGKYIFK